MRPLALVVLTLFLLTGFGCGGSAPPKREAVPRGGVGDDTVAVFKVDLQLMDAGGQLQDRIRALGRETGTDWSPFGRMIAALSSNGVSQIAIPIGFGPSMLEAMGVYLGGPIRVDNEDLEATLIAAGGGSPLAAAALMTAVTDTPGGWKFWGVGGGRVSNPNRSLARRFEDAFAEAGAFPMQLVLVMPAGEILGEFDPQPSDPRLLRQVGRLLKSAKGMESLRLAIEPEGAGLFAGALFDAEASATAFVSSWSALARDLQLAAGPADPANARSLASLFEQLGRLTPRADGRWVRWRR